MKVKIYFHLNMTSPELEIQSKDDAKQAVQFWCATELKMPPAFLKAISVERIEEG